MKRLSWGLGVCLLPLALAGCDLYTIDQEASGKQLSFPEAVRVPLSDTSYYFPSENEREHHGEASRILKLADIAAGQSVADIGAGEGYYTLRLSEEVGPKGRVLAQDIDANILQMLGQRVERERLDNVSIKLGEIDDPKLPAKSFDRIFLIHVYPELQEPYAFLWHLQPSLREGGNVIVFDSDAAVKRLGLTPSVMVCEFAAAGFRLKEFIRKPDLQGYFAKFEVERERPSPEEMQPCHDESVPAVG